MTKTERVNARITKEHKIKLDSYCKHNSLTLSQWVTDRINLMRYEVPSDEIDIADSEQGE